MAAAAQLLNVTVDIPTRHRTVSGLRNVDLTVTAGRITALVGESGCGKSLVAAALCGLLPPGARLTGALLVDGTDLANTTEQHWQTLRGHHIGLVPQSAATSFTPVRTIGSQLAEVCRHLNVDRTPEQLCAAVQLPAGTTDLYPYELSGGMAQRVAVAAAIAARPALVVADEPTSALDSDNAALVWTLLARAAADGAGVLVVTHDLPSLVAAGVCDQVALMRSGTVIAQAPMPELGYHPDDYVRRFLGASVS